MHYTCTCVHECHGGEAGDPFNYMDSGCFKPVSSLLVLISRECTVALGVFGGFITRALPITAGYAS